MAIIQVARTFEFYLQTDALDQGEALASWAIEGRVGLVGVRGRLWVAVGMGGSQGRQCAVVLGGGCESGVG